MAATLSPTTVGATVRAAAQAVLPPAAASPTRAADTVRPTLANTERPTPADTVRPTLADTVRPTLADTVRPTPADTVRPTLADTVRPTLADTVRPTLADTVRPTLADTVRPTLADTVRPTLADTVRPTLADTVRLTLADAVRLAEERNVDVAVQRLAVVEADARADQARSDLLPHLRVDAQHGDRTFNTASFGLEFPSAPGEPPLFDPDGEVVGPVTTVDVRGHVSQTLLDWSAVMSLRAARADAAAREVHVDVARERAALVAATAWVTAARAEARVEAREADRDVAGELLEVAEELLAAGVGVRLDVTRARARLADIEAGRVVARGEAERARLALLRALDLPLDTPVAVDGTLPAPVAEAPANRPGTPASPPATPANRSATAANRSGTAGDRSATAGDRHGTPGDGHGTPGDGSGTPVDHPGAPASPANQVASALARRPEVLELERQIDAARLDVEAVRAERLPTLSLVAGDGLTAASWSHLLNTWEWGVRVSVPVFEGGSRRARTRQEQARVAALEARRRDVEASVAFAVRDAVVRLDAARELVAASASRLDLAREELDQARERFAAGVAGSADVFTASLRLSEARTDDVDARGAFHAARVALAAAEGSMEAVR